MQHMNESLEEVGGDFRTIETMTLGALHQMLHLHNSLQHFIYICIYIYIYMHMCVFVVFVCLCYVHFAHNRLLQLASVVCLVGCGLVSCDTTLVTEFLHI